MNAPAHGFILSIPLHDMQGREIDVSYKPIQVTPRGEQIGVVWGEIVGQNTVDGCVGSMIEVLTIGDADYQDEPHIFVKETPDQVMAALKSQGVTVGPPVRYQEVKVQKAPAVQVDTETPIRSMFRRFVAGLHF